MEVVRAVVKLGFQAQLRVAVTAAQKSHSYGQLLASAWKLSNTLLAGWSPLATCEGPTKDGCKERRSGDLAQVVKKVNDITNLNGARIGIMATPSSEFVAGMWATWISGAVVVPLAVSHPETEILYVMNDAVQMLAEAWEYRPTDRFLHCLPLHHIHGLINGLLAPLYAGGVVDFMPKFSVREVWQRWSESYCSNRSKCENAITVFTGVPTMYSRLLQGYELMEAETQKVAASAASQLRLMMCGSAALPYPVLKQWESLTGHRLLERYGMTEFMMALSNPLHGERRAGMVGKPLPGVQVKIVPQNANNDDALGIGELCVKSPSMFKEYWKQSQITKDSFGDDGYFKTGDTAAIDEDGFFVILGRTSVDILKVAGYKLSALEIEAVLLEHPDIAECAVLGISDTDYGEIICAIIVPEIEAQARAAAISEPVFTIQDLQKWTKEKVAPYKIPQRLHIWESLPRNAMGKVNKKELKQLLSIA